MKHTPNFSRRCAALLLCSALALACAACGGKAPSAAPASTAAPAAETEQPAPSAPDAAPVESGTEYRAVWVSYLEWMSFDFSSADAFTAQAAELMENTADMGLNTVIAQVRPFSDAFYPSALYPWSHIITGTQGGDPGFDPLAILVEQAHAKGLKIEAWLNPYRVALNETTPGTPAENNLANTHPEWVKSVKGGLYLNPALPEVQQYIIDGVTEIVERYEVDGIQFDDYFYPTTEADFDETEFSASGTGLELAAWRRENVNTLVSGVYRAVKSVRPSCIFGISPQGNNSNNYNGQYSDVALWLSTPGYVDYIMPQIYWGYGYTTGSGSTAYAFENVTKSWAELPRNPGVALYFGLGAYRIGDGDGGNYDHNTDQWQTGHILADMVNTLRDAGAAGFALYRYDFLFRNSAWPELAGQEAQALTALLSA